MLGAVMTTPDNNSKAKPTVSETSERDEAAEKFAMRVWLGPEEYDDQGVGIGLDVSPIKTERHKDEAMLVSEHEAIVAKAQERINELAVEKLKSKASFRGSEKDS